MSIKCPHCYTSMDSLATVCRGCGARKTVTDKGTFGEGIGAAISFVVIVWIASAAFDLEAGPLWYGGAALLGLIGGMSNTKKWVR